MKIRPKDTEVITLEGLVDAYNKKRSRTIFDQDDNKSPDALLLEHLQKFANDWINVGGCNPKEEVKQMDTIDAFTQEVKEEMIRTGSNFCDYPPILVPDEEKEKVSNSWYLTIPPLEKGVLRVNRDLYLVFEVTEIVDTPEDLHYDVNIEEFQWISPSMLAEKGVTGKGGIWLHNSSIDARISREVGKMLDTSLATRCATNTQMMELYMNMPEYHRNWKDNEKLFLEEVLIPYNKTIEFESDSVRVVNQLVQLSIKINCLLENERPKAKRRKNGTRKVTIQVEDQPEKNPKPKVKRVFTSGISITSKKCPSASSGEVIRKYKVAQWTSRGHIRHYKNGKQVYVKPSIHHRKCFQDQEGGRPQSIIKLESKLPPYISKEQLTLQNVRKEVTQ